MEQTTVCYLEKDECYLMMHRIKKKQELNAGKWIGVGGHFEKGESPEECILREVREETGLSLLDPKLRGVITFDGDWSELMFVFTATRWTGTLADDCDEGVLEWIPKAQIFDLNLWEGDQYFLKKLIEGSEDFFSMKLTYHGDTLVEIKEYDR